MVLKETFQGPICHSHYTKLIKLSLQMYGQRIANSLGVLITEFRDNILENSNFKVKFYLGPTEYLILLVKGGMGKIARTKYLVNEDMIYRYDWRSNFWHKFMRIVNFASKVALFFCKFVPGGQLGLPYVAIVNRASRVINKMITYDKPIAIRGRSSYSRY